jgi:hypothetical protein
MLAHSALKEAYPEVVKEHILNMKLIKDTLNTCHLVKDNKQQSDLDWISFNDAEAIASETEKSPAF